MEAINYNSSRIYSILLLMGSICFVGCGQKSSGNNLKSLSASTDNETEMQSSRYISKEEPAVIYRSIDMGNSWSPFASGIPLEATLSGIQQFENKVYVTTDFHGVFVSVDGDGNWRSIASEEIRDLDINCIQVVANRIIIGTLNQGIYISQDEGITWKQTESEINNHPIRAFNKIGNSIYAGTDSGIYRSDNYGDTWIHEYGKLQILGFTALGNNLYAATQNGVLTKTISSKKWKSIYDGDALHDIGNDGTYIYAMTIGQQLLKSKNNGDSWENAQSGIPYPVNFYTNEIIHSGNNIFSAQWIGIYHSIDNGESWEIIEDLPDSTAFSTLAITDYGILAGISIR